MGFVRCGCAEGFPAAIRDGLGVEAVLLAFRDCGGLKAKDLWHTKIVGSRHGKGSRSFWFAGSMDFNGQFDVM